LTLTFRDRTRIELRTLSGNTLAYDVLEIFPFTSESKRMGIVVRDTVSGEFSFLQKGADVVMAKIVQRNDWLEEETANMAREGLRTLVVARRKLSEAAYEDFKARYHAASVRVEGRNEAMAAVVAETLERDLELLGLTGVEDKLQDDVRGTLELLRNAGIKIWMLTGDKIETATVIAISTKLVARNQYIHQVAKREFVFLCGSCRCYVIYCIDHAQHVVKTAEEAQHELDFLQNKLDCCLVIDGESLQVTTPFL
jgi:phospholipid-translocating ATPase